MAGLVRGALRAEEAAPQEVGSANRGEPAPRERGEEERGQEQEEEGANCTGTHLQGEIHRCCKKFSLPRKGYSQEKTSGKLEKEKQNSGIEFLI